MRKNTETIVDDNGFEMLVAYKFEVSLAFCAEHGNPSTHVETSIYTELDSVELVIANKGVEFLHLLDDKQKEFILSKLTYEC